ncbi:MAG TPA: TolC family protein [Vicinamibacterales bacterium]|nr:TolC family protein [Vicinamibacterales bacterium]
MNRRRLATAAVLLTLGFSVRSSAQGSGTQTFSLEEALQYAIDHYPTVRAALEQSNASAANVDLARSSYLPQFDAFWQTNRATANNSFGLMLPQSTMPSISGPVLPSPSSDSVWGSAVGGLLTWEPFDFGLRESSVREAEAGERRARADESVTRLGVQRAVAVAFLGVVSAQQALTAAEADVQRRDVLARAARVLTDNQLRPGAEASRAEAELAAARTREIQVRQAVLVARATLSQMLGIPGGLVDVNASRLLETVPPNGVPPAPAAGHPLLQSGQAAVHLARARETVLAKTDYPRVYLQSSVSGRGSGGNPDGSFDGGADGLGLERANWAAGVQVVFPNVFGFSSRHARQAAASALTRAEGARYEESVLTVTAQQRTADAMVDAARAIARNTPIQLAAARQSEAQARARYEAGLAGIVDVADAQHLLAGAEYQDGVARVDVWRSLLARAIAHGDITPFIEVLGASGVK